MRPKTSKSKENILDAAIPIFAEIGYGGLTMRSLASDVGITAASLYHHFPDKKSLHLAAMKRAFSGKDQVLSSALEGAKTHKEKLSQFVHALIIQVGKDKTYRRLIQRELLDGDEERLKALAEIVFKDIFDGAVSLTSDLDKNKDPHLLAVSIAGLVIYHYLLTPLRPFFSDYKPVHDDTEILHEHIMQLLTQGLDHI